MFFNFFFFGQFFHDHFFFRLILKRGQNLLHTVNPRCFENFVRGVFVGPQTLVLVHFFGHQQSFFSDMNFGNDFHGRRP